MPEQNQKGPKKEEGKKVKQPIPDPPESMVNIILIGGIILFIVTTAGLTLGGVREFLRIDALVNFFYSLLPYLLALSLLLSGLLILGIIHSVVRLTKLNVEQRELLYLKDPVQHEEIKNQRWEKVMQHINSENSGDWRLAILEADIILEEMMEKMGYLGDTLGERLKHAEKSDFNTIEEAWEAHKIRNSVAHQGADFSLTEREARRVINLYRAVFEEFHFI